MTRRKMDDSGGSDTNDIFDEKFIERLILGDTDGVDDGSVGGVYKDSNGRPTMIDSRNMFNLFLRGVRPEDIAKVYGITTKTVYNHIHKFVPNTNFSSNSKYKIMRDEDRKRFRELYELRVKDGDGNFIIPAKFVYSIKDLAETFGMSQATVYVTAKKLKLSRRIISRSAKRNNKYVRRSSVSNPMWILSSELGVE